MGNEDSTHGSRGLKWLRSISVVSFEDDGNDEDADWWFFKGDLLSAEEMKSIMERWIPTPPSGDGWILAGKFDCDDGPHALFVKPKHPTTNED